jgi:hypothetical protein
MTRRATATPENRVVARELMARVAAAEVRDAEPLIASLSQTTDPEQMLDALAALRAHRAQVDTRIDALLGLCVLEGAPVGQIAGQAGIKPRTLTRRLAGTPAAWVGRDLTADPRAHPWGWRPGN